MDIEGLMNWVSNALVCGILAMVLATGWVWFIWSRIHALRARREGVDEEQSRPSGLVRVTNLLELFELAPWQLERLARPARLARLARRKARRTGSWWDD